MDEKNYVALFKNHKYILAGRNNYGKFDPVLDILKLHLPTVYKEDGVTKELLDGISDLGYTENADGYGYTIWDKKVDSYTKLTVPVYVEVFGKYKYTKKSHTFEFPSDEAIMAANDMSDIVKSKIELMVQASSDEIIEKKLDEGKGIAFISIFDLPCHSIFGLIEDKNREFLWCIDGLYVIGDITKVTSLELKLYVPRRWMGAIIGKGGSNVRYMAEIMRVEKIHVLPLEEKPED